MRRKQDMGSSVAYSPQLLGEHLSIAHRRPRNSLPDTALRTRSLAARQLLAYAAAQGSLSLTELVAAARGHRVPGERLIGRIDAGALVDLARVMALQDILTDDKADALALYDMALNRFRPTQPQPDHQGLHAQLAYDLGDGPRVLALLRAYRGMPEQVRADLMLDLANPFTGSAVLRAFDWLDAFQRLFPKPYPVIGNGHYLPPFDRLMAVVDRKVAATDRISVVVTTFRPDTGLLTAVRSILSQSWEDLEVIVVDDGSPPEFDAILRECRELDPRVAVITLDANGGTYRARNAGIDAATGRFVTFQDSDDWSHPRRLEMQVQPLLREPSVVATISDGLRVNEDLVLTKPGRNPRVMNTSSLMLSKEAVVSRIGYFDDVRKAADSEYLKRIESVFGATAVRRLHGQTLALIRLSPGSLSRAEIRAGWMDPARVAYRCAYELWHGRIRDGRTSAYVPRNLVDRPFPAPQRLRMGSGDSPGRRRYDVVLVNDWRWPRDTQRPMLDEIRVLTSNGMRVGVLHMESFHSMTPYRKPLCPPVQELVNDGVVDQVLLTDAVEVALLMVGDPSVLEFPPSGASRLTAARTVIVADRGPRTGDGSGQHYTPDLCAQVARQLFGADPQWCPRGLGVREHLASDLASSDMTEFDLPRAVDLLYPPRQGFRLDRPVIGRVAVDSSITWPADRQSLLQVYPDTPDVDVRVLGAADRAVGLLGTPGPPPNWLVYGDGELTLRNFMFQIDFYVDFPCPDVPDESCQVIVDALASGCVVIVPQCFSGLFGDAAVYRRADQVRDTIRHYYHDPALFIEQSRRGRAWAARHCEPDSYLRLVKGLIGLAVDDERTDGQAVQGVSVSYVNQRSR